MTKLTETQTIILSAGAQRSENIALPLEIAGEDPARIAPRVAELKSQGAAVLCWTIRSPEAEAKARRVAQNVTFEGYLSPTAA